MDAPGRSADAAVTSSTAGGRGLALALGARTIEPVTRQSARRPEAPASDLGPRDPTDVHGELIRLGLADSEVLPALDRIRPGLKGLLLYGSRARGDFLATSDFDVLRLAETPAPTFRVGRLSVSSYTTNQLLSATRTLFGTHLLRDGTIVYDPDGALANIMRELMPADPQALLHQVRAYSVIFDIPFQERTAYCAGLVRLARYLLRTAIYARAMLEGNPCFSVRELAIRFDQPELSSLLASDPQLLEPPSGVHLEDLITRLRVAVGPLPENPYKSLTALAVGMWDENRLLSALAIRAASEDGETIDYTDLPKVLL